MIKEAVLSVLPAHTTEIICYQNCLWIEVLPQNLHTEWLWLQAEYAILISVVGSVAVYRNLFMSFCSVIFGIIVPSASFDLTSVPESSQMRRTPWQPIAVCAVAAAAQSSHFSQCFVVKFCINHFQFFTFKKLVLCVIFYGGFHLNCVNFRHSFNAVLFVRRLMTKDVTGIQ